MTIPFALKAFIRVVNTLESQELRDLRITLQQLLARSERVVRQEPAPVSPRSHVDQPTKCRGRMLHALGRVAGVEVHDGARVRLLRPGEKAFVVFLDQPDRAVNAVHAVEPEVIGGFGEKLVELIGAARRAR